MRIGFHDVQRVGVARSGRTVDEAHVREQSVEDDERALPDFERDELVNRPGRGVVIFKTSAAGGSARET